LSSLPREAGVGRPWYREPWPWLLMAGPLTAVIAGFVTLWLAIESDDGLVADDYYKQGLAINEVLHRDQLAARLGYEATLLFSFDQQRLRVTMHSDRDAALPGALRLRIVHPTRPGADQTIELPARGNDEFNGVMKPLGSGRWLLILEDVNRSWRLTGEMRAPQDEELELRPQQN